MESIYNKKYLKYKHKYLSEKNKLSEGGMGSMLKMAEDKVVKQLVKNTIPNILNIINNIPNDPNDPSINEIKEKLIKILAEINTCENVQCIITKLVKLKEGLDNPKVKILLDNPLVKILLNKAIHIAQHPPQAKPKAKAQHPPQAKPKAH
jgi:hypothetical protein